MAASEILCAATWMLSTNPFLPLDSIALGLKGGELPPPHLQKDGGGFLSWPIQ